MAFSVRNKTALVTGGGSGICLAFTKLLVQNNCNVVIADLKLTKEAEKLLADNSEKAGKGSVTFIETNVTDWKQLEGAFTFALEQTGDLHIICPGAGIFDPVSPLRIPRTHLQDLELMHKPQPWSNFWNFADSSDTVTTNSYKTLEINITHPIRATQLAIDHFRRRKQAGAVILISSIAAQLPILPIPLYSASKAAISSFVRSMAELEPRFGIRVNAVAPGLVKTPIWSDNELKWVDERRDAWVERERVAEVMLNMIEKEGYVGGTVLEVGSEVLRKVEVLNDPGFGEEKGCTVANIAEGYADTFKTIEEQFGK